MTFVQRPTVSACPSLVQCGSVPGSATEASLPGAGRLMRALRCGVLAAAVVLSACASLPDGSKPVAHDPLEVVNRATFAVNDRIDAYVLKPVAVAYADCVPEGLRGVFGNIFGNVADVWTAVNQLLQAKPLLALGDLSRFAINTTLGFFGVADIASHLGLEKHKEDLGQTLGYWGVPAGPYLVLPIFGPSSIRDSVGFRFDLAADPVIHVDPISLRNSASVLRAVDTRAGLLPAEKIMEGAALDKYSFIRDGYLQRRNNLVYDGNPPLPKD